jgi:ergothioneine biosynthesis protein EgtB
MTATERLPQTIDLAARYRTVRAASEQLCAPLETEDYVPQSMEDCSPTRWHLAHVSWFFEALVLDPHLPGYEPLDERFHYLFNSYYNSLGKQWSRSDRGVITRPTVSQVYAYRAHVDVAMGQLFESAASGALELPAVIIEIGLQHEQQHQELIVTDFKHLLSRNPVHPVYLAGGQGQTPSGAPGPPDWTSVSEGTYEIGMNYGDAFVYDIETPRHTVYVHEYELAERPVTCGEYLAFMADGGYRRPEFWLSAGWAMVQEQGWTSPLYWESEDEQWYQFTLSGRRKVDDAESVCHVSMFEADAYANWAGARLPTEAEWEVVAARQPVVGNFVEDGNLHPVPQPDSANAGSPRSQQMFGGVWEWTRSAFASYPGYKRPRGAIGEYNAKFMSGQYVLRGGSCATPESHVRATYRNFFFPSTRWQFSGIRLAR